MNAISLANLKKKFDAAGQGHVFKFFSKYPADLKQEFINQAQLIDLEQMYSLINEVILNDCHAEYSMTLMPPEPFSSSLPKEHGLDYSSIIKKGEEAIRAGRLAALVVAGGQGTRLGFDGPKGILPITPVKRKSFFQVFAEKIKVAQERYQCLIPWYVMTSQSNYDATVRFFEQNNNFGLNEICFFNQGMTPVIDLNGKFLLDEQGLIAMAPDGHGGCFEALLRSGLFSKMEDRGIDLISYFQVDNPLVKCIDPLFIGLHVSACSEMSSKCVKKLDSSERVGLFCKESDHLKVIEYSYAPEDMLTRRRIDGGLFFNAGNIAVHLLDRVFAKKMGGPNGLKFHHARKMVPYLGAQKQLVIPDQLNSIKFEKLIFDALAQAKNPVLMEVRREDEFSPVKNAKGKDSPQSSSEDQLRQSVRWLKAVNINIPLTKDALPLFNIEISPSFADTEDTFVAKWQSLARKPEILREIYLDND